MVIIQNCLNSFMDSVSYNLMMTCLEFISIKYQQRSRYLIFFSYIHTHRCLCSSPLPYNAFQLLYYLQLILWHHWMSWDQFITLKELMHTSTAGDGAVGRSFWNRIGEGLGQFNWGLGANGLRSWISLTWDLWVSQLRSWSCMRSWNSLTEIVKQFDRDLGMVQQILWSSFS